MYLEDAKKVRDVIRSFRDELNDLIIYVSEDPDNETVCENLREVRDGQLQDAIDEKDAYNAVVLVEKALIKLFGISSKITFLQGNVMSFQERALLLPTGLNRRIMNAAHELIHYGAELPDLKMAFSTKFNTEEPFEPITNLHSIGKLRDSIYYFCTRREDNGFDLKSHPNSLFTLKLRRLSLAFDDVFGGGLLVAMEKLVPPSLGSKPIASGIQNFEHIEAGLDNIFSKIRIITHSEESRTITPLRETREYRTGNLTSFTALKRALKTAVEDWKKQGMQFPKYEQALVATRVH